MMPFAQRAMVARNPGETTHQCKVVARGRQANS